MSDVNIKEIIKQEYIKCCLNPVHFFRKYCYISHPIKGRILFHLFDFQEEVLSNFRENRFVIVNKSRQLGLSTLAAGYALWLMLFNPNKVVLCVATKQETAKGMVEKVQFMYNNLPKWLRGNQKPLIESKLSLKLPNNSEIIASSAAPDAGRRYSISLLIVDEAAFIEDIDKIYTGIKPTIATGGSMIALSSPNGIGNWFHKTYIEAVTHQNEFKPIELKWDLHPERDQEWYNTEKANMSAREFAQEYDCDFLGSGNSVVENEILTFYEENWVVEPIERRFMGGDFWIWEYVDYSKQYIICADVARGDGMDYSSFHVINMTDCIQVAEYKSQIGTREYGNMLVSVATEYNNAMLVVENAGVGWDVVNTILERGYNNMYYSPRSYGDMHMDKFLYKMDSEQTIPGFTTSPKTRPLVISKMEAYIREKAIIIKSKRLLEELRVFIWHNGKAQAQQGYNDDLVMSLGIGLFVRDTAMKFLQQGMELTKAAMLGMGKTENPYKDMYPTIPNGVINPYRIPDGKGGYTDVSWVL